jgi:choline dehydrogenase-like flavoprotein
MSYTGTAMNERQLTNDVWDVVIIGSGHAGGMAAKILTESGIRCLMLNAGPVADVTRDAQTRHSYELPYRGFHPPGRVPHVFQANEYNANVWVDEQEVPYTIEPEKPYNWVRVRLFGGRSLFWSRQSFRLSDYEFKACSHDGFGQDWPISHADLAPYYARVEGIFQVTGALDGPPQMPGGNYVIDSSAWCPAMQRFMAAGKKVGMPVCKQRAAVGRDGLASSVNLLLPDAERTGKLTSLANAVVREITVDKNTGLPNGCSFVDRLSHREMTVKARVIVLAAGTLESTRLLLNSKLANSSGLVGRYLMDQIYGAGLVCSVPEARNGRSKQEMGSSAIVPRFRNIDTKAKEFLRGYAFNVTAATGPIGSRNFAAFGSELERKLDEYDGSGFHMTIMGEVLGRYENHVRIDETRTDAWGIPVLHVDTKYTDNEYNMAKDAVETASQVAQDAGFEILSRNTEPNPPGYSIHEVGTCRMGDDKKKSVLNKFNQSHDHRNLFVVDGAGFTSAGWQNPTMTILSLSMRASEYLAGEMTRQNL